MLYQACIVLGIAIAATIRIISTTTTNSVVLNPRIPGFLLKLVLPPLLCIPNPPLNKSLECRSLLPMLRGTPIAKLASP